MEVPIEFERLVDCFHGDSLRGISSENEWISSRLRMLSQQQKTVVRSFLDDVFEKKMDGADLRRIWKSTNPDLGFPNDEHLRAFLDMIRQQLSHTGS